MQYTANTTISAQIISFVRSLVRVRSAQHADCDSFTIYTPAGGVIGSYASVEAAETALHYLPYSVRQQAEIHDADGYCLCR